MGTKHSTKIIKVAILAEQPLGWGSGKHYFPFILNDYSWMVKQRQYKIVCSYVYDKDIIQGKLLTSNFDVLLVPGGGVGDGECITKGFKRFPKVKQWKKNIKTFIQNGKGYVGFCGGAALLTNLNTANNKKTLVERLYDNSSINVSSIISYYRNLALPIFYPKQNKYPEHIGAMAYVFSFKPGETNDNRKIFTAGFPLDFKINKSYEFFKGYDHETLRMRWWGGPGLQIQSNPNRNVDILARYPSNDFTKNKRTRIHAWVYTGGIYGLIRGFKKALFFIKKENLDLKKIFTYAFYFSGDWKKTDKFIRLDMSDQIAMTFEKYPNEHRGRIFLCAAHPEYMIWDGGFIEDEDDTSFNCIGSGFHQWKSIQNFSETGLRELTSSWWVIRRAVAWAAKVPDEDFPPIKNHNKEDNIKKLVKEVFWDGTEKSKMENI